MRTGQASWRPPTSAALRPAVAEIRVLVDVRLVDVDQQMPIVLGAGQQALERLDKGLPLLRIGPSQQLLGFLPGQLAAMESRADRLAAAQKPEPLAHPADQAAQRPARGWVGPFYGWRGGRALGGADHLAEFGFALRAKKGRRPPVRRNASAAGPPWL